jgi:hypothetical protein
MVVVALLLALKYLEAVLAEQDNGQIIQYKMVVMVEVAVVLVLHIMVPPLVVEVVKYYLIFHHLL